MPSLKEREITLDYEQEFAQDNGLERHREDLEFEMEAEI